jgi:hypothetical protein
MERALCVLWNVQLYTVRLAPSESSHISHRTVSTHPTPGWARCPTVSPHPAPRWGALSRAPATLRYLIRTAACGTVGTPVLCPAPVLGFAVLCGGACVYMHVLAWRRMLFHRDSGKSSGRKTEVTFQDFNESHFSGPCRPTWGAPTCWDRFAMCCRARCEVDVFWQTEATLAIIPILSFFFPYQTSFSLI